MWEVEGRNVVRVYSAVKVFNSQQDKASTVRGSLRDFTSVKILVGDSSPAHLSNVRIVGKHAVLHLHVCSRFKSFVFVLKSSE